MTAPDTWTEPCDDTSPHTTTPADNGNYDLRGQGTSTSRLDTVTDIELTGDLL